MRCRHNYFLRICVIDWTMKTMLEKKNSYSILLWKSFEYSLSRLPQGPKS